MIRPVTAEQRDDAQEELRARLGVEERRPPAPVKNRPALVYLTDPLRVPYRGRLYELPPVSYMDGVRITDIMSQLEDPDLEEEKRLTAMQDAAALIRRLVTPDRDRGWWLRLRWKLRLVRNPFRPAVATEMEIGELLGFLAWCRTMSSVRRSFSSAPRGRST